VVEGGVEEVRTAGRVMNLVQMSRSLSSLFEASAMQIGPDRKGDKGLGKV
jgi:hypothetical protein